MCVANRQSVCETACCYRLPAFEEKGEKTMDNYWFEEMEARIPHGQTRTRFAPSPTGYMHVGNLRTALYTYLIAKKNGGKFIIRIEDTDQYRYVAGATEVIYKTLRDCHLIHDEGPDVGGPVGPYIQTERREIYGKYAQLLLEKGGAYRCFCEKTEQDEGESFEKETTPAAALQTLRWRKNLRRAFPLSFAKKSRTRVLRPSTMKFSAISPFLTTRLTITC